MYNIQWWCHLFSIRGCFSSLVAFKSVVNIDLQFPCRQRCFPMTILTTDTRKVCRLLPEVAAVSILCCQLSFVSQCRHCRRLYAHMGWKHLDDSGGAKLKGGHALGPIPLLGLIPFQLKSFWNSPSSLPPAGIVLLSVIRCGSLETTSSIQHCCTKGNSEFSEFTAH